MPVPKRKRSRARRDKRFANKGMKPRSFTSCANCEETLMAHQACGSCGYYKGRKVLETKGDRAVKRDDQRKAKEARSPKAEPVAKPTEQ